MTTAVWEIREPTIPAQVTTLTDHSQTVEALAFSGDGRVLITGSADATAIARDSTQLTTIFGRRPLLDLACAISNGGLDLPDWESVVPHGIPYQRTCPQPPA